MYLDVPGVAAVGVALVATASKSMCKKLCATPLLAIICTATAVIAFYWPKPYTFPVVIVAGGLTTILWSFYKKEAPKRRPVSLSTISKLCGLFQVLRRLHRPDLNSG